jgi:hypothetical protein
MNKTDIEMLEMLLEELSSLDDPGWESDDLPNIVNRLGNLANQIYDHLSSKTIQTDYVMPRIL